MTLIIVYSTLYSTKKLLYFSGTTFKFVLLVQVVIITDLGQRQKSVLNDENITELPETL